MEHLHLALLLFCAIFSTTSLAARDFRNCSSLERFSIDITIRHAQRLITIARFEDSHEFIQNMDEAGSSQEMNETNERWREDIYKSIAMEQPKITFSCNDDNTTIQTLCDAAPGGIPNGTAKSPILLVKTDIGSMALCKNYTTQDNRSAARSIAHELVMMAERMEQDRRAEAVVQHLKVFDHHAQQSVEALRDLLLSLDNFYVTDFWKRSMDWYSEKMGSIMTKLL